MRWIENYRVSTYDTDISGNMRASAVLRFLEETANLQMKSMGPSNEQLRADGKAFILSRLAVSIYKPLHAYDEIVGESWGCDSKGVSYYRCGRLLHEGNIAAEMVSVWALLDIESRRLCRVGEVPMGFDTDPMLELDLPHHIRIPKDLPLSLMGERTVSYSDLDINQHMNNTVYADVLCDFVPHMCDKRVIGLSLHFVNEAKLGETIKVYCGESDESLFFRTVKEDGSVGIEAEMLLEQA